MFKPLDDSDPIPSKELDHFTNRVEELAALNRILKIPQGEGIPFLSFYGVGGIGKTWLLKHLHQQAATLPKAYIDLDTGSGGQSYQHDPVLALGEIRRQLGASLKCPRFDLAYTWLRFHQGVNDEPLFKGSGALGVTWELIVEAGGVAANDIPGASLVTWLVNKVSSPLKTQLGKNGVSDWLATQLGQDDFLKLKNQLPVDIYPQLHRRLLQDFNEHLPARAEYACRAIVFIDTLESIRPYSASDESLLESQRWLRELYHPESGLLIITGGRDRLNWDRDPTSDFAKEKHLEQHLVGGLSVTDATLFLTHCGIDSLPLQQAILTVSLDKETDQATEKEDAGYHPFSLGLCADTCQNLTRQNELIDPALFDMSSEDTRELATRFLRSMGANGTYAEWLKRLALTPQFDEAAARACFSDNPGREQDFAWHTLTSYSFIRQTQTPGWFTLHIRMKESLVEIQHSDDEIHWHKGHQWWHSYWTERPADKTKLFAAKAWYHHWCVEPEQAMDNWNRLAQTARNELQMMRHYELLGWWAPCALEAGLSKVEHKSRTAATLHDLGNELCRTSQGDRTANLQRAINGYEAALRIRTEAAFPQDWAATQNNLANAYAGLPEGDRTANLQRAINGYEAALRIRTETAHPRDWAMTQNNLAIAYADLHGGDHAANLHHAIDGYKAALRIYTETTFPQDWAMTQNNLATAYACLPGEGRAANLQRAINCYEAALRVYTETAFPQNWATTQYNLAIAYAKQSTGDRSINLQRAIDSYKAALRIFTKENFPHQNEITTQALEILRKIIGDINC